MEPTDTHQVGEIPDSGLDDSGLRHTFKGGGQREMAPGKGRFDLLSPLALFELAKHMEAGAVKYSPRNWEKGLPLSSFVDSAMRHLSQLMIGDVTEPHAVAALWNLHCLVHTIEAIERGILDPELDDLPQYLVSVEETPAIMFTPDIPRHLHPVRIYEDDHPGFTD